jgi:diguanylate cyclase (GGDEF)-like protein/PAS domain S-box-containing protein
MSDERRPGNGYFHAGPSRPSGEGPVLFDPISVQTQTIDLNSLFAGNITESGSFDVRGVRKTTLARLLDAVPIPAALLDGSNIISFSNDAFSKICQDRNQLKRAPLSTVLVRDLDREQFNQCLNAITSARKPQSMEAMLGHGNIRVWGRIHMRSVRMGDDRLILILIEDLTAEKKQSILSRKYAASLRKAHDDLERRVNERTWELLSANDALKREVSVRKKAQKSLNLAARVISSCNEAILITDPNGNMVHVNEAFSRITGYSREEVIGKNPGIMASGRHGKEFWEEFWITLRATGHWRGEVWDRKKNGDIFPKLLAVSAITGEQGAVTNYVGIFSDITKMKQTEAQLENLAHYDPLTQLPNRLLFRDRVNQALLRAERDGKLLVVMFVDLDGFKQVNDTLGHPKGDELLVAVSERICKCVRRSDTVARLGGDEFTVIMPDVSELRHVMTVAQRITDSVSAPFSLGDSQVFTSASIGISVFPTNGQDIDILLKHADTAMYCAKSKGKNGFQFFSEQMNDELTRLAGMEGLLRGAMDNGGLLIHYQPVYDACAGRVISAEALLRLRDPKGGVISAGPYIPVAEDRGLILPIGEWVLQTACEQNKLWRLAGHDHLRIAVNVSMRQLQHPDLFNRFLEILEKTGCDPTYVELEITESLLMENSTLATETLTRLRELGASISIDDFGKGYSSLNRLRQLPVDKLKIDQSFVAGISTDPGQKALIQAIVTVAHSLNMKVTAEGVETKDQLDVLCELNCDALQGHYFSPAVPAEEFEKLVCGNTLRAER